jgi:hypothetical protein
MGIGVLKSCLSVQVLVLSYYSYRCALIAKVAHVSYWFVLVGVWGFYWYCVFYTLVGGWALGASPPTSKGYTIFQSP